MIRMLAGTARINITPQYNVIMGGYPQRGKKESAGVRDPIWAKALFLSDGTNRVLIISADLYFIPNRLALEVTSALQASGVCKATEVCLCATNTHSAPELMERYGTTESNKKYIVFLRDALVSLGQAAARDAYPSRFKAAVGRVEFLFNRRTNGEPNRIDPRLFAMQVDDAMGKSKAVLFGLGCRACALGYDNDQLTSDFPGHAQRLLEDRLGTRNAIFLNLSGGNIIPKTRKPGDLLDPRASTGGTFADAEKLGSQVSDEVSRILRAAGPMPLGLLRSVKSVIRVKPAHNELSEDHIQEELIKNRLVISDFLGGFPEVNPPDFSTLGNLWPQAAAKVIEQKLGDAETRKISLALARYAMWMDRLYNTGAQQEIPLIVQDIVINDYRFLALPGEILVEGGMDWQQRNGPHASQSFCVSLANGYMGPLPHPVNFQEEDADSLYETVTSALEPNTLDRALTEGLRLLS